MVNLLNFRKIIGIPFILLLAIRISMFGTSIHKQKKLKSYYKKRLKDVLLMNEEQSHFRL